MDRGAWRVTVHGCTESDTTEQLTQSTGSVLGTGSIVKEMDINKIKNLFGCLGSQVRHAGSFVGALRLQSTGCSWGTLA